MGFLHDRVQRCVFQEVYRFFGPNAVVAYNGKTYNGPETIAQFMKNLAPTKHDVFTLNVHEVPSGSLRGPVFAWLRLGERKRYAHPSGCQADFTQSHDA